MLVLLGAVIPFPWTVYSICKGGFRPIEMMLGAIFFLMSAGFLSAEKIRICVFCFKGVNDPDKGIYHHG